MSVAAAPATAPALVAPRPPGWVDTPRVVVLSLLIIFAALCGIAVLVIVGVKIGATALAVGVAAAVVPVPILVGCFLWLDRYQPSPLVLLATSFVWGAGPATLGALGVNMFAAGRFAEVGLPDDLVAVLVAPFIEESLKAVFPIALFVFYRKAFAGFVDAIIYCGISAAGFAMVENIFYLGGIGYASAAEEGGVAAGAFAVTAMFIVRVVLTGFAHPLFTAMTGIGLGIATRSPSRVVRVVSPIIGLVVAMMLHGAWNLMAVLAVGDPLYILYGYFAVFMPIFFAMVGLALWLRSWEGRLAERVLPGYAAAGWFCPPEVAALATLGRRQSARRWAGRVAGVPGAAAMRWYQFASTRLALVRDGINRGLYPKPAHLSRALAEERRLLATIDGYRRVFTGRDPLTPRAWWSNGSYQIEFPDGVVRGVDAPSLPVVPVPVVMLPAPPGPPGVTPVAVPTPAGQPWQPPVAGS